jgi:hypothetical protein
MKGITRIMAVLAFSGWASGTLAGAITTFTDRVLWEAAVIGSITTDPFDNDIGSSELFGGPPIVFDSWVTSEINNGSGFQCNFVGGGNYNGCVGVSGDIAKWTFPGMGNAFGFDYISQSSLDITITYDGFPDAFVTTPAAGGFFGLISDGMEFSMITFTGGGSFDIDNLSFNHRHGVPIPSTLALFTLGLAGLVARRKA